MSAHAACKLPLRANIVRRMDRDKCIELIRTGCAKFSANDVTVSLPNASLTENGFITCSDRRFRLSLRAPAGVEPPSLTTTFVGRDQFGTATGQMDHSLAFKIPAIQPCMAFDTANQNVTLHFNFDRLDFSEESSPQNPGEEIEVSGLLENYELIALGTVEDKLPDNWSFGMIQRGKDLEFVLRKSGGKRSRFDEERCVTEAFLRSIAFIHGQHAGPLWMRHRRDGKYVLDWIRPPRQSTRSPHRPFNERIWFNARVGQITWSFNESLLCAFKFFLTKSDLAEEIAELLHQIRDATAGDLVRRVNNIVLCALLDSAVNAICESRIRLEDNPAKQEFDRVRTSIVDTIKEQSSPSVDKTTAKALDRWSNILSNTSYWYTREKFQAVVDDLGLKWSTDWEDLYKFWDKWRHPIIHRASRSIAEHDFATFKIQSRIAGAIYLLVLRAMGYKGIAVKSAFEDVFTNL